MLNPHNLLNFYLMKQLSVLRKLKFNSIIFESILWSPIFRKRRNNHNYFTIFGFIHGKVIDFRIDKPFEYYYKRGYITTINNFQIN